MSSVFTHRYVLRNVAVDQRQQWDEFVNQHRYGHFLQSWGWGELKAGAGWYPLRLALYSEQEQQIVGAAQVLCRTAPHLPLWAGHLAYVPKGPVIDWSQPALCSPFFAQLHAYLHRRGALALRLEPGRTVQIARDDNMAQCLVSTFLRPVAPVQPVRTILLDLNEDEPTLLARMKEKWRYNLRLAERKGVTVRIAATPADVQAWYALLQTTSERDQFGIHTLDYYVQAWQIFVARQQCRLYLAEYQGQLIAGIFVGLFARQGIYLYGASSNEQRNLMPNYLLQWEAIRWAKQQGALQYDFWGIPATDAEDEPLAGVYRFKRGWGGEVVRYVGCYEHVYHQRRMKIARKYLLA
ncbi:MAG: peptidoglycan bridge formation glycyltransferase FemA/FemB family protein [Ktedonobacteraceae bacterium]